MENKDNLTQSNAGVDPQPNHGNDDKGHNGGDNGNGNDYVNITINDVEYPVHRGNITVSELKQLGGVNPAWVLYLFGQAEPLDDAAALTIKGGEVFMASARSGQSS